MLNENAADALKKHLEGPEKVTIELPYGQQFCSYV